MNFSILSLLLIVSTSAFSYVDMDDRLDTLEKDMTEISARNPQGTLGAGFTTSRPKTVNHDHWFTTFDVIYWHPKMGGTEYAFTNTAQGISITRT